MQQAFSISDNEIQRWSEPDLAGVNADLADIGDIDFDIELLGIKNFMIEPLDKYEGTKEKEINEVTTENECPSCGYKW